MKKRFKSFLGLLLVVALVASMAACGGNNAGDKQTTAGSTNAATTQATTVAEKPDPFGKMPELVEFTTGRYLSTDPKAPEGETIENNDLTKFVEDTLNVKQKVLWTTTAVQPAFEDKVNLLIASNDIPDVLSFKVVPQGEAILKKLVQNDMIQDLTKVYEDYASPSFKEHHEASGNAALQMVTFDGKLMALPSIADTESEIQVTWIRNDWLKKLGLPLPKTLDDLAAVAKAFIEQDPDGNGKPDTLGMIGSAPLFYKNATASFDTVFNAFGSYPGDWIKDASGNIVYGSTLPETKAALAKLAEWYKAGLIDKEFALKDTGKALESINGGQAGILPGAWWSTWWPLNTAVTNDPKAEWIAVGIAANDGTYKSRGIPPARDILVIKKDFKYPEAIIKTNNLAQEAEFFVYDWYNKLKGEGGKYASLNETFWPVSIIAKYSDEISKRWKVVKDVIDGVTTEESMDNVAANILKNIKANQAEPMKDMGAWATAVSWTVGADVFLQHKYVQNTPAFSGTTETMLAKMTPMTDLEKDTFIKIIMGKLPIDEFDKFVTQWKSMGGDEITKEVNEITKK